MPTTASKRSDPSFQRTEHLVEAFRVDVQMQHRGSELAKDSAGSAAGAARGRETLQEPPDSRAFFVELLELALDQGNRVRFSLDPPRAQRLPNRFRARATESRNARTSASQWRMTSMLGTGHLISLSSLVWCSAIRRSRLWIRLRKLFFPIGSGKAASRATAAARLLGSAAGFRAPAPLTLEA
jgi:hypothetical protein